MVLVTGASGMIGQHIIRELQKYADRFEEIRTVDRKPFDQFLGKSAMDDKLISSAENLI